MSNSSSSAYSKQYRGRFKSTVSSCVEVVSAAKRSCKQGSMSVGDSPAVSAGGGGVGGRQRARDETLIGA